MNRFWILGSNLNSACAERKMGLIKEQYIRWWHGHASAYDRAPIERVDHGNLNRRRYPDEVRQLGGNYTMRYAETFEPFMDLHRQACACHQDDHAKSVGD